MNRPVRIWLAFALALTVMFAVMAWVSVTVLRLDRAQWEAQLRAEREEAIRLALWRMEAALTPLTVRESARPYFAYLPLYPAARPYGQMLGPIQTGEPLAASELLAFQSERILVHFHWDGRGDLASPQAPDKVMLARGAQRHTTPQRIAEYDRRLKHLGELIEPQALLAALPGQVPASAPAPIVMAGDGEQQQMKNWAGQRFDVGAQSRINQAERQARGRYQQIANTIRRARPPADVREGDMHAVWLGSTLLLARRIQVGGQTYVQGCWLDWPRIKAELIEAVGDLLPRADLSPAPARQTQSGKDEDAYTLAALPAVLVPGELPTGQGGRTSPLRLSLLAAWGGLLLAAMAVAVLLFGALSLGRRRTDFVSTVTHELRTPLTTFRMYTEMLADGTVQDESQRASYLATLRAEADRLRHLVENVLTYARLEARQTRRHAENLPVGKLLDDLTARLEERARHDEMELVVQADAQARSATVLADPWAVELILFNLVDNACKYSSGASDRRVHLEVAPAGQGVSVRVRDHGPGLGGKDIRGLFRPFRRSARSPVGPAGGVGLGLTISRRLARNMGGSLEVKSPDGDGACFELRLPPAPSSPATD